MNTFKKDLLCVQNKLKCVCFWKPNALFYIIIIIIIIMTY
jgi:hypothetical protein